MMDTSKNQNNVHDLLDMHNYRIEKLPKRIKTNFEKWLSIVGVPLALISFILFAFVIKLPFLQEIDPTVLSSDEAKKAFNLGFKSLILSR